VGATQGGELFFEQLGFFAQDELARVKDTGDSFEEFVSQRAVLEAQVDVGDAEGHA
jgi:hypothetical protein